MESHFRVELHRHDRASVIALVGELDLASSPQLEQELAAAIDSGADAVVVDLRGLEFIDSTGLSVLLKAHQRAQELGRRFGLVRGGEQVQRLLDLTGLSDRLPMVDDPGELVTGG